MVPCRKLACLFLATCGLELTRARLSHASHSTSSSFREASTSENPCALSFRTSGDNEEQLWVGKEPWLTFAPTCVRHDGKEDCTETRYAHRSESVPGVDTLGAFDADTHWYSVSPISDNDVSFRQWKTSVRVYENDVTTLLFEQEFLDDLNQTNVPGCQTPQEAAEAGMASLFPSFSTKNTPTKNLGALHFAGMFVGEGAHQICPLEDLKPTSSLMSGPLAIFNDQCVLVWSAASQFMDSSSMLQKEAGTFGFGVLGSVTNIPKHHRTTTIVSSFQRSPRAADQPTAPDSIRQAFAAWGQKLQTLHQTRRIYDPTLEYLQYSTDNGAYYYYHKDPTDANYQETMLNVYESIHQQDIPVKSWLLDSWFYYKGQDAGVKEWVARPDIFPDGLAYLREHMSDWMIMAHNRYWSAETVYAEANGGDFAFVIDNYALPLEERFWDWFLGTAKKEWGLSVYEQDWLNYQTRDMNYTLENINAARTWLLQMGGAAERLDMPIQYCMSWPRHILQSLEVRAVTQTRGSDDVLPDDGNSIQLGLTNMFSYSVGLAPHKDSFWSTPNVEPPNNPYSPKVESASTLLSVIATYSMGPVAPSDHKNALNRPLIMKSCRSDGTLLKPDLPAIRMDSTFWIEAGVVQGGAVGHLPQGQVWSTRTTLAGYTWTYILAAGAPAFDLTLNEVYPSSVPISGFVAMDMMNDIEPDDDDDAYHTQRPGDTTTTSNKILRLSAGVPPSASDEGIRIPASNRTDIQLYIVAPSMMNGWTFLGEVKTKWTAVSANRFSEWTDNDDGFHVTVSGGPGEVVDLWLITPNGQLLQAFCTLSESTGMAIFELVSTSCHPVKILINEDTTANESKNVPVDPDSPPVGSIASST